MTSETPTSVPSAVIQYWQDLLADAEATADDYRATGWEALVIHPGDVTPIYGDPFGLEVLAPGDEFAELGAVVDELTFRSSHVYWTDEADARLFVVVVEAPDAEFATVIPAFVAREALGKLEQHATQATAMYTHIRPLSDDQRITFTHDEPGPFFHAREE